MKRWWIFGGVAASLALSLVVIPTAQASADTFITPGLPVVNVLPSTVVGAAGRGLTSPEMLARFMQAGSVDGNIWKLTKAAEAARVAGTASTSDLALLATNATKFAPMSTRMALMSKAASVAGPAGVLVSGFYVGLGFGNTASRIIGFKDSMVCTERNGILSAVSALTNNVDCSAYQNTLAEAARNADQPQTVASGRYCLPNSTVCAQVMSIPSDVQTVGGTPSRVVCFSKNDYTAWVQGAQIVLVGAGATPDFLTTMAGTNAPYGCNDLSFYQNNAQSLYRYFMVYTDVGKAALPFAGWRFNQESASTVHPVTITKPNPDRTFQCKVTNTDGTTATKFSKVWTQNDPAFAVPECPAPLPGKVPDRVEVGEKTGTSVIPLINEPTTPEWKASRVAYPNCGTGLCELELTPTATPAITCHQNPTACAGWYADPLKAEKFKCTYGPYPAPLSECTTLAPMFEPGARESGKTLGDPETGLAGPQTSPTEDPSVGAGTNSDGQCFPSGWGVFNPVEWVLKPLRCAFSPRPEVVKARVDEMKAKWDRTAPVKAIGLLTGLAAAIPADASCGGITINWPAMLRMPARSFTFLNSCTDPLRGIAVLTSTVSALGMIWFSTLRIVNLAGGAIGFNSGKAE